MVIYLNFYKNIPNINYIKPSRAIILMVVIKIIYEINGEKKSPSQNKLWYVVKTHVCTLWFSTIEVINHSVVLWESFVYQPSL